MSKRISKVVSVFLCLAILLVCIPLSASAAITTNGNGGATDVGAWFTTYNTNDFWGANGRFSDPNSAVVGYKALKADGTYGIPYSQNVSEIDFQIKKMAEAGIDFIVFDLTNGGVSDEFEYGTGDNLAFIINNAKLTCERISEWNNTHSWKIRYAVAVGIYANLRATYVGEYKDSGSPYTKVLSIEGVDTVCATTGLASEVQAQAVLDQFVSNEEYGDDYYTLDGKPLLVLHETGTDRATEDVASYTGDKTALNQFTVRDSNSKAQEGSYGWYTDGAVADDNNCGTIADDEVMLVCPGQCNHSNGNNTPNASREDGEHYKANWEAVFEASPRIVMISSLNDYMEDTAIWPARTEECVAEEKWDSPYQYWDLTVDYINTLRTANGDVATTAAERSGNVALGATVTANSELTAYPVSRLTDGLIDYDRTTETTGITRYDSDGIGYFEVSLASATAINQVKVFRTTWESELFPNDIAIDIQDSDGDWKRVAEMHDIEASVPHDLTFNFAEVSDAVLIRVSANKARNSSTNFRVSEIEAYNDTTITSADYTGTEKDATYNIPEMASDNYLLGITPTVTSGRTSAKLDCLTDGDCAYGSSGQTYVLYGAGALNTNEANTAYYQFDFDEAVRMNLVQLYLSSAETTIRPLDIAVDVQLADGSWKRVAANYNISYSVAPTDSITVAVDGVVQTSRLEFTFETVECIALRLTSNRQRTRVVNSATSSTYNWRLVEATAYNDPTVTTYTGVERPDNESYIISAVELENVALGATVTTKGQVHGVGPLTYLVDGDYNNRTGSYYYTGKTAPTEDSEFINWYNLEFTAEKEINRVDVVYSKYSGDDGWLREKDIAVDVITSDGRYVRVAEKHNFDDAVNAANGSVYVLSLTFDVMKAIGIRVSTNCAQQSRYLSGTYGGSHMFHVEVESYNDPNVMSNTGIEDATVENSEIPTYLSKNFASAAMSATVTSSNTNASLETNYPISRIIDGSNGYTNDCAIINYVDGYANIDITFGEKRTINQVILYLSIYEPEKLPTDMAVYAKVNGSWVRVSGIHGFAMTSVTSTTNSLAFNFAEVKASAIRLRVSNANNANATNLRLVEIASYYDPSVTSENYTETSFCDVNDDLLMNSEDLVYALNNYLLADKPNCDVNKDGVNNIFDFIRLKKMLLAA